MGLADPGGGVLGVRGADDQRAHRARVARAELERNLSAVAVAADHRAAESERCDQRGDVVGQLGVGEMPGRIRGAAVPAAVGRDHAEVVRDVGQVRLPHRAGDEPAVDEHKRGAGAVLLVVERGPVDLDRGGCGHGRSR